MGHRFHEARLIEFREAEWPGVRAEVITREADVPCQAGMCLPVHTVSLLFDGGRSGFVNQIEGGTSRRVGHQTGWIRVLPAGREVRSLWERGRRTYLLAFIDPGYLSELVQREQPGLDPMLRAHIDLRSERLQRILGDMRQEICGPGPCTATMGAALAQQLAVELIRSSSASRHDAAARARGGLSARSLRSALALIEQRLADKLTLRDLAAAAGLSEHHFAHAFRQSTGMPPARFVQERRMALARELLADPAISLTEVALHSGFGSSSHFATAFRRAAGMSPRDYRRAF